MFLARHFHLERQGSKVLVFVNSISYVYRLQAILSLLLGKHPALQRHRCRSSGVRSNNKGTVSDANQPATTENVARTPYTSSDGVRLLSQLLFKPNSSTPSMLDDKAPERQTAKDVAHTARKHRGRLHPSSSTKNCSLEVQVLGIHSKLRQTQRLNRIEKYVLERGVGCGHGRWVFGILSI